MRFLFAVLVGLILFVVSCSESPVTFQGQAGDYLFEGSVAIELAETPVPSVTSPIPTPTLVDTGTPVPVDTSTPVIENTPTSQTPLAEISKFDVYDADRDLWFRLVNDGDTLDLSGVNSIAIGARIVGENISGVEFNLAGVTVIDNESPYVIPGDVQNSTGQIDFMGMQLTDGNFLLTATVIGLDGITRETYEIEFTVVGSVSATPTPVGTSTPMPPITPTPGVTTLPSGSTSVQVVGRWLNDDPIADVVVGIPDSYVLQEISFDLDYDERIIHPVNCGLNVGLRSAFSGTCFLSYDGTYTGRLKLINGYDALGFQESSLHVLRVLFVEKSTGVSPLVLQNVLVNGSSDIDITNSNIEVQ